VPQPTLDGRPEVILDVAVRDGLLSVTLSNIGPRPALAVTTTFDAPLTALGGTKKLAGLRVFRELAFMAPGKVFEQFVDPLAAYVARQAPLRFTATITYKDREDRAYEESMTHDLRVYLELGQATTVVASAKARHLDL